MKNRNVGAEKKSGSGQAAECTCTSNNCYYYMAKFLSFCSIKKLFVYAYITKSSLKIKKDDNYTNFCHDTTMTCMYVYMFVAIYFFFFSKENNDLYILFVIVCGACMYMCI